MQKEFRQIFREKANLGIIFVMPFIQLLILGFAITTDVRNIAMAVVDHDHSVFSRQLIAAFGNTATFRYYGTYQSTEKALRLMDKGLIKMVLVIENEFERKIKRGEQPGVQILLDGVDGNSSGITAGYANKLLAKYQEQWHTKLQLSGEALNLRLITIEPRYLYNPQLDSTFNIVPGIIVLLLTMITLFLTTINIVREKEIGTLEQIVVTPITNTQLILGKVLPFVILGFILFNIGIIAATLIFHIYIRGSLLLLYTLSCIYMLNTLGLGIFISTIASTQQQAMFYAWFFSLFAIMLSGLFIPVENMPDLIQYLTYLNPTRYFMEIVRGIFLKGSGPMALWPDIWRMSLLGLVIIQASILRFHKRLI